MEDYTDKELQNKVENVIKSSEVSSRIDVNYKVSEGVLSLWGIVDVLAEKKAFENMVSRIPGIRQIDNNLTVGMDRAVSDEEIAEMVTERMEEVGINLHKIGSVVETGNVTIVGTADTLKEQRAAIEAAEGVYGVKEVLCQVKVTKDTLDDATITNMIELEFSRSDNLLAQEIHTMTKLGVVYLKGYVDTTDQIGEAIETVSGIKGVREIRSELIARHGEDEGDMMITNHIRDILGEKGLSSVKAFVVNGILFLDGEVATVDQKHKAVEALSGMEGINGINNAIVISRH